MTISIWRFSHLSLAITASLFLIIASITGAILSFEPIANRANQYSTAHVENLPLSKVIDTLRANYLEVISIERDQNDFFKAEVITNDGELETFYIDLTSGNKTGEIIEQSTFFEFITSLHRSLFLGTTGRIIIGISALILMLIVSSGIILIFKRLNSFSSFYKKIDRSNFYQYSHVSLGRLMLIPLLIVSITGTYFFLERIGILEEESSITHNIKNIKSAKKSLSIDEISIFKETKVSDIGAIEFPFSPDEEDYFLLKTHEKELAIHQYSGKILSSKNYPFPTLLARLNMNLHTGKSNRLWAIVLLLASLSILFFIYSGFSMTLKRWKGKSTNKFSAQEAEIIVLFGSENGGTKRKAFDFYNTLIKANKKAFIAPMNEIQVFENIKHLVILTSTHGNGEAPKNANKFIEKLKELAINQPFYYSIVGFGSYSYPDFCNFALDCEQAMMQHPTAVSFMNAVQVHNQSAISFGQWFTDWTKKNKFSIVFEVSKKSQKLNITEVKVLSKTEATEDSGHIFLLELAPKQHLKFQSGDLLGITPEDGFERLYSIGKGKNNTILLSIKIHESGICSNLLHQLKTDQEFSASIKSNPDFHLHSTKKDIILIANGTGIAPFLGMISENKKLNIHLYWGGRTHASFAIYESFVNEYLTSNQLASANIIFSREGEQRGYVWNLIEEKSSVFAQHLANKGLIYICGSLAMEHDVARILDTISSTENKLPLSHYQTKQQIKKDCY